MGSRCQMMILSPIKTPRLLLRPVKKDDRLHLMSLEDHPEVMLYLNGGQRVPSEGDATGAFLTPRGEEPQVMTAIAHSTEAFVGWFALFDDGAVNGVKTAELGYRLRRECWGQGYATEGASALVEHAFKALGFERIIAKTMMSNLGSRKVLEKLGFQHIETEYPSLIWPIPGKELGEAVYHVSSSSIKKFKA